MATKEKLLRTVITLPEFTREVKPAGVVFVEWDILFKDTTTYQERENIVAVLLEGINEYEVTDETVTTSLKYNLFKSENNENLFVLRVYRESDPPYKKPALPKLKKTSAFTALIGASRDGEAADPIGLAVHGGPVRTPGPPIPPPPTGVEQLTNTIGLSEA